MRDEAAVGHEINGLHGQHCAECPIKDAPPQQYQYETDDHAEHKTDDLIARECRGERTDTEKAACHQECACIAGEHCAPVWVAKVACCERQREAEKDR